MNDSHVKGALTIPEKGSIERFQPQNQGNRPVMHPELTTIPIGEVIIPNRNTPTTRQDPFEDIRLLDMNRLPI